MSERERDHIARHLTSSRTPLLPPPVPSHRISAAAADVKAFGTEHTKVAVRYSNLGGVKRALGDLQVASDLFTRALNIEEASTSKVERTALSSYLSNLAGVHKATGQTSQARSCYFQALQHLRYVTPNPNDPRATIYDEEEQLYQVGPGADYAIRVVRGVLTQEHRV